MTIQSPEGTRDLLPDEAKFWAHFKAVASDVFGAYGYVPIETPVFEQTDLFVRGIGEATDVVSKEMFTALSGENLKRLLDGGAVKAKSRLSLRPEGTAGVVRAVVQHDLVPQGAPPVKLVYAGPMFRAERPQKGRQRQFNQVGIECLGAEEPSVDAEGIIMLMRFYAAIGIPVEATELLVNSMGCDACRPPYRDAVKAYMDAHADELCDECKRRADINPLRAFDCKNPGCAAVMEDAPKITDHLCDDCRAHYGTVKAYLDGAGPRVHGGPEARARPGLLHAHRVRGAGDGGYGQSERHRWRRALRQAGPGGGWTAHARLRLRTGLRTLRAGTAGGSYAFPPARRCDCFVACVDDSVRAEAFSLVQALRDAALLARWTTSTAV